MSDFCTILSQMRRPSILMRAVRFGLGEYQRGRLLKRLTPGDILPERTVPRLFETEARLEEIRQAGDAAYSVSDHIEVLVALIAESRLLRRTPTVQV